MTGQDEPHLTIYGLWGFTHGWAKVITVMSPLGASAILEVIKPDDSILVYARPGTLTQYHSGSRSALRALAQKYSIIMLSKPEWDTCKTELGDAIWG